jgi:hypothetical protein
MDVLTAEAVRDALEKEIALDVQRATDRVGKVRIKAAKKETYDSAKGAV